MNRKTKFKIIISAFILVISVMHYFIAFTESPLHNFYRLLYFIPIVLAAFNFGFKGGVFTSLAVSLIYSPFMLLSLGAFGWQTVNELVEIILFFAIGVIAGILVENKNRSLQRLDNELKRYILLENYTNSILQSIQSGVIAVNNDMLITMINKGAKKVLDVANDCIGQNFTEVFNCCATVREKIKESILKDKVNENVEITRIVNGGEVIIRISVFPLSYEGVRKGLVIIVDDITEVKKLHQQIQRNDKLSALGELSAGIAHEIRNPLGIIKAIEQTMKNEFKNNPEAVNELQIIDEEVERANRIVKSLLEFGKPSKYEKILYSVEVILEEVLTITNKYASQHGVHIVYKKAEIPNCFVDKDQLKQAFINIILNAVQAMPMGGELNVSSSSKGLDQVRVLFKDSGEGIPQSELEKIFNPFYTTKAEGTGLGLSIVNRIIDEHGGGIHVSSRIGEGTLFEINLPIGKVGIT